MNAFISLYPLYFHTISLGFFLYHAMDIIILEYSFLSNNYFETTFIIKQFV